MDNNIVLSQIGNTPLVKLKQASELTGCNIFGKALGHVQHYKDYNYLEYELFRNNKSDNLLILRLVLI